MQCDAIEKIKHDAEKHFRGKDYTFEDVALFIIQALREYQNNPASLSTEAQPASMGLHAAPADAQEGGVLSDHIADAGKMVNQTGAELVNRAYELLDRIDIQTRATGHAINGVSEIKAIITSLTAPNPQPVSAALEDLDKLIINHVLFDDLPKISKYTETIKQALAQNAQVPDGWVLVQKTVVEDIQAISHEYHRQVKAFGYFDTPGGIENPQDAFDYINKWAEGIAASPVSAKEG